MSSLSIKSRFLSFDENSDISKTVRITFDYQLNKSDLSMLNCVRYFCSHNAGIHMVSLPMVSQLEEFIQGKYIYIIKRFILLIVCI